MIISAPISAKYRCAPWSHAHHARVHSRIPGILFLCGLLGLSLAGCNAGGSTQTGPSTSPATLSSTNNPNAFVIGVAGTYTFTASGAPMPTLGETGALPSGLVFTNNSNGTATLGGTPAAGASGNYPITISAQNGVGAGATQKFTLAVNQAPAITSASSATFLVGTPGSFSVTATGVPAPTLAESGILPTGVTFNAATGALSGTPTVSGAIPLSLIHI